MMPEDTNYMGKIFGGAIISQLDLAAAEHCYSISKNDYFVTRALKEVTLEEPVFVGDVLSFYTTTEKIGNSSITVGVTILGERNKGGKSSEHFIGDGSVVLVAIDKKGKATKVKSLLKAQAKSPVISTGKNHR